MPLFVFSKQERRMLIFLLVGLAVGAGVDLYRRQRDGQWGAPEALAYRDSLRREFLARASDQVFVAQETIADSSARRPETSRSARPRSGVVNINRASVSELQRIPHIGPVLAGRIVAYRQEHGPFGRIEDLKQVKGIGEKTIARIRPYLTID